MPEYSQPKNDAPNPYVRTFNPEKTTENNNKTFSNVEGWQTSEEREKRWEEAWSKYERTNR